MHTSARGKIPYGRRKETTSCLHCGSTCVKKTGAEIYRSQTSRDRYGSRIFHACPLCEDTYVGCHDGTDIPLGYAANRETRQARMKLHNDMLDPLWAAAPNKRDGRSTVYRFLTYTMGLDEAAHVGDFTLEQCREAWRLLSMETYRSIEKFVQQVKEDENA
jgi:hypothetical protein